jgi:hypothetical protein
MNIYNTIIKAFANNLAEIDTATITTSTFNYVSFINDIDQLLCIALENGDVVEELYIKMINQALNVLSSKYKDKYLTDYRNAVAIFEKNQLCDRAADFVCTPEYLGQRAEEFYHEHDNDNDNEDDYEMNMALGQYSKVTEPEREHEGRFDYYFLDSENPPCRSYKRLSYNAFHVCNEGPGYLVQWFVDVDGNYYSFIDYNNLTDVDLIIKMETFFHSTWVSDPIDIVTESNWIINDDHSESKRLIGVSRSGYHFGYLGDHPDSEPVWLKGGFATIDEAEEGRWIYSKMEEQMMKMKKEGIYIVKWKNNYWMSRKTHKADSAIYGNHLV